MGHDTMYQAKGLRVALTLTLLPALIYGLEEKFRGGHIRPTILKADKVNTLVQFTVFSAWQQDSSPCGPGCTFQDIGLSTSNARQDMLTRSGNLDGFGDFTLSWDDSSAPHNQSAVDVTKNVTSHAVGHVFDVDDKAGWVQEMLTFNMSLSSKEDYYNISMEGMAWPSVKAEHCSLVNGACAYYLQSRITLGVRNDTGSQNKAPLLSYRPMYQVPLGDTTSIQIHALDDDGDIIKCRWAQGKELHVLKIPAGVAVTTECQILVDASQIPGIKDQDYIVVPVMLDEIVSKPIKLDNGNVYNIRDTISTTQLDVAIQFVTKRVTPEFVPGFFSPCGIDVNDEFASYATHIGSDEESFIFLPLMAKPGNGSDANTVIDRFRVTVHPHLPVHLLPPRDIPTQTDQKVRMTDLTATFHSSDAGDHFVQLVAMDTKGALSDVCILRVDVKVVNYTLLNNGDFIGIPGPYQIQCPINAQCDFPVYIKDDPNLGESALNVESHDQSLAQVAINSEVKTSLHGVNSTRYQVYLTGTEPGTRSICFQLKMPARSMSQCVQIDVVTPDPCLKVDHPCTDPSQGICHINETQPDSTYCECQVGYGGDHCEKQVDPCQQGYCGENSISCKYDPLVSKLPTCQCFANYTGARCDQALHCFHNPCQPHGECQATLTGFTCQCHEGFTGPLCEQPTGMLHIVTSETNIVQGLTERVVINCTFSKNATADDSDTLVWVSLFSSNSTTKNTFQEIATVTVDGSGAHITASKSGLGTLNVTGQVRQTGTSMLQVEIRDPEFKDSRYFRCEAEDVDARGPLVLSSSVAAVTSQMSTIDALKAEIVALRRTRDAILAECEAEMHPHNGQTGP